MQRLGARTREGRPVGTGGAGGTDSWCQLGRLEGKPRLCRGGFHPRPPAPARPLAAPLPRPPPRLGHTLQTFQAEAARAGGPPPPAAPPSGPQAQPDASGDAALGRGLLGSYAADAAPQQYLFEFDALLRFVDASLDLYKVGRRLERGEGSGLMPGGLAEGPGSVHGAPAAPRGRLPARSR
jgi:hypothetical protein